MAHVALSTLRHRFCFYLNYSNLFSANHEQCFFVRESHVALSTLRFPISFYLNYSNLFSANHEQCFFVLESHVAFVHYIAGTTYI